MKSLDKLWRTTPKYSRCWRREYGLSMAIKNRFTRAVAEKFVTTVCDQVKENIEAVKGLERILLSRIIRVDHDEELPKKIEDCRPKKRGSG